MSQQLNELKAKVSGLVDALIDAADEGPYPETLNDLLNNALVLLQKTQNAVVQDTETAIIAGLSAQNQALGDLNKEIDAYSKNLDASAQKIKSIADDAAIVAGVVAGIVSSGIL